MELRVIRPEEAGRFVEHVFDAFDLAPPPEELALVEAIVEPGRCVVAEEDGRWVATAGAYTRELTLPGRAHGDLGPLARALRTDRAPWPAEQF